MNRTVWLFDLDDTLHDAGAYVFGALHESMGAYVQRELQVPPDEADRLRRLYWLRYGATLLGLVRHHDVKPAHFLRETHLLPDLEERVTGHRHDLAALRRLPGRKVILTNAPRAYALRVLAVLGIAQWFDAVVTIEDMAMFGQLRPKPDARMLRAVAARLRVPVWRCVLVEDTLQHQKAARRIGMHTVWMQRFGRRAGLPQQRAVRWTMRPGYVDKAVRRLGDLLQHGRHRPRG
ncbi:pyrimidine 5'-nucleotidase [Aquincola sp. MAHUQ-54]|uniref:phosphoglycolate phosphatase n=1 Tax=Aquincola agrisoli TaxID=3119538 RepID=A0AAW9QJB7_9BURK